VKRATKFYIAILKLSEKQDRTVYVHSMFYLKNSRKSNIEKKELQEKDYNSTLFCSK
jgi:hypothetical protein